MFSLVHAQILSVSISNEKHAPSRCTKTHQDAPRRTKVSKIPFFDFSFTLLDLLRRNLAKAPAILERINRAGMAKLARGVEALCRLAVITSSRKYIVKTCKDI